MVSGQYVPGLSATASSSREDHLKLAGGHLSLYWLYTPEGVRQDLVGTTKEDLTLFLGGNPGQ